MEAYLQGCDCRTDTSRVSDFSSQGVQWRLPYLYSGRSRLPHSCILMLSGLSSPHCPDSRRKGYIPGSFIRFHPNVFYPSSLSLVTRWAVDAVLHQEGPTIHAGGFRFQSISVLHWIERVVPNTIADHRLRDPVAEAWHIGLSESKGPVGGEVHRVCDNKYSTVDSHVLSVALLWCLLALCRFPVFYVKGNALSLVFLCQPRHKVFMYFRVS